MKELKDKEEAREIKRIRDLKKIRREQIDNDLKRKLWKARGKAGAQQDRLRKKETKTSY